MKLLKVDTIEQAREKLLKQITWDIEKKEKIPVEKSRGRVLASDVRAENPLPYFKRATVDGYGVKAADTQGAGESIPVFLEVKEEIEIGTVSSVEITGGTCAYVPTGGMIPQGADAMVMVEYTEPFDASHIAVYSPVPPGAGILQIGEDVERDQIILARGTRLRAAQIGALAGNGIREVEVYKPLKVTILSTGDELTELGCPLKPGCIYDINTPALAQMGEELGFEIVHTQVLPDQEDIIEQALRQGLRDSDLTVISGGSSQGKKDMTSMIMDRISRPGVFTHGLALKPGKPTILAVDTESRTVLMGLPGHPAASLLVFRLLAGWLEEQRTGCSEKTIVPAVMESNVPAAPGKDTILMVRLIPGENGIYRACPVLGKSGLMRILTGADGFVRIPLGKEGLKSGERVMAELL